MSHSLYKLVFIIIVISVLNLVYSDANNGVEPYKESADVQSGEGLPPQKPFALTTQYFGQALVFPIILLGLAILVSSSFHSFHMAV